MKISALFVRLYKMTYQGEQNCHVDLIISLMVNVVCKFGFSFVHVILRNAAKHSEVTSCSNENLNLVCT